MGRDPVLLRVRLLLALFLPALFVALPTASGFGGLGGIATALTAGFAAALVVAVVLQVRLGVETRPSAVRTLSLRERAKLTVFLRLRDPDARGRTRPRAPGFGSAAA
ncbi:DUF6412 domain-containing protein [Labedaea rhizosphaerae]|uniref:Uncharacterized protein n=1 Tax=Labedaea rhizosphaerae TaxID=598644 RepID=A0A4R6SIC4_LABRH|nr:DUF6412 domain-containing protein [Labedaea rhizosphaerae]TDQ00718.1 hypothetical protein EV186_102584 [Labedaea rhizosphaerae]